MPALKASCSSCGKPVQRGPNSRPEIVCHDCRRQSEPQPRWPCATCGGPILGQGRTYCSLPCSNRDPSRQRLRGPSRSRVCEVCGEQYHATYREQRTCGRACGVELRRREGTLSIERPHMRKRWPSHPIWVRECAWCNGVFIARRSKQVTCSLDCTRKANWANDPRRVHKRERHCPCGQQIPLTRRKCDDCRDAYARKVKRQARRRRKALERGARTSERYWFDDIAARDRYRCGICRKRVAMTKAVPHPKAPTIDHIVPLAEGGEDTAANVRLAHFICNSLRGDRGGLEQLAMFG